MTLSGTGDIIDSIGTNYRSLYIETTSIFAGLQPYSSIDILNSGDDSTTNDRIGVKARVIGGVRTNVGFQSYLGSVLGSDIGLYVTNRSVGSGTLQRGTYLDINSGGGGQDYDIYGHDISIRGTDADEISGINGYIESGTGGVYGSSFVILGNSPVAYGYNVNIDNSSTVGKPLNIAFNGIVTGTLTDTSSNQIILQGDISGDAEYHYGTNLVIRGGRTENYGDYINLFGSIGLTNYGSKIINSIADPLTSVVVSSYGQHITVDGVGEDLKTFKFGSSIFVSELSKESTGQGVSVVGASGSNIGVNIRLTNSSGLTNWGQKIALNSPMFSVAPQNIVGQEITALDAGDTAFTYKWGQKITITGAGRRNYGIVLEVSGGSQANEAINVLSGISRFNMNQDTTSDVQILGATDATLFLADVSADAIGMGTVTPETKLDVRGTFKTEHNPSSPLIADGFGYGDIVTFGTGSGITQGKVYYLNSSLVWTLTDANAAASATGMLAVAIGTTVADGMLVRGYVRNTTLYTEANGAILYLSAATTGNVTATAPSGSLDIVRIVGYQIDSTNDIIYFNPDNTWVEI
jgi:hypothetical protein